ncbi:hypothetical protein [Streptomyces venetus]
MTTGIDGVTLQALQVAESDEPWAEGGRTRVRPGLFDHITTGTSR